MPFLLLITRGNASGQQVTVTGSEMTIGRDGLNDLVLTDAGVSRRHTRIIQRDGIYVAEDLDSSNGTLVNGEPIIGFKALKTGDSVAVGTALMAFKELPRESLTSEVTDPTSGRRKLVPADRLGLNPIARTDDHVTAPGERSGQKLPNFGDESESTSPGPGAPRERDSQEPTDSHADALALTVDKSTPPVTDGPTRTDVGPPQRRGEAAPVLRSQVTAAVPRNAQQPAEEYATEIGVPATLPQPRPSAPRPSAPRVSSLRAAQAFSGGPPSRASGLAPMPNLKRGADLSDESTRIGPPAAEETRVLQVSPADSANDSSSDSLAPLDESKSLPQLAPPTRAEVPVAPSDADATAHRGAALSAKGATRRPTDALPLESAADRARRRRELGGSTLGGQLLIFWGEMPLRGRLFAGGAVAAIVVGSTLGLMSIFAPADQRALPREPAELSATPIPYSFGLGDDVHYLRPDAKEFTFEVVTATDAAVLVHYQSQEISADEVLVNCNGDELGQVPVDIGVPDRQVETLIPPRVIKRGEKNRLVFDNVQNPPGTDTWRVSNISIEVLPVPPLTPAEAMKSARDNVKRGQLLMTQREAGSENVFRAWKAYRQAWQALLAVPDGERATYFEQVRRRADEIGQELDQQCGKLMLDAKKQMELRHPGRAKEILEQVSQFFPTAEHRCHTLANEKLTEYQL